MNTDYEEAFSDFMDCEEYDSAQEVLFQAMRAAFKAGWLAGVESKIKKHGVLTVLKSDITDMNNG